MTDGAEVAARVTPDERQARDWVVVLGAAGVPCRMEQGTDGWHVVVGASDAPRAFDALAAYDAEAIDDEGPEVVEWGPTRAGLVVAALLVAFYPLTGFRADARPPFLAGEGNAAAIVAGQYWRTVTALTLHADATHLFGNVVAMAVLATAVCRLVGPGLGVALMLVAGAAGNGLNAWVRSPSHVSVGASTAIFGALGILAGLAFMRAQGLGRRPWVPLAAALALLGLLGTGEHADLVAHFMGFQVGVGLGLGTAVLGVEPPGARVQRWLAAASAVAVGACWLLALWTIRGR